VLIAILSLPRFDSLCRFLSPSTASSQPPGTPRISSWTAALGESMDTLTPRNPAVTMRRARSRVNSVPFVVSVTRMPRAVASATSCSRSGRSPGSPPVKCTLRQPRAASSVRSSFNRPLLSCRGRASRQWLHIWQRRLQP
jgi:hypothetical protein